MAREKPFDQLALILDLETVAIADAADYLEPAAAPANYRDAAKIAAYVQEKTADRVASAALDPNLCTIVAIGFLLETHIRPDVILCPDERAERAALLEFWRLVACDAHQTRTTVGFNSLAFDLPVLMQRSRYLDILPSRSLSLDKYRSPHLDLLQYLTFRGVIKAHSLAFYCKRFGIPVEDPDITGADIAGLVARQDWEAVRRHCASDVLATCELAQRLHLIGDVEADGDVDETTDVA
jgi:predicted PolB exonuclease-like 3'-5' exonuclease